MIPETIEHYDDLRVTIIYTQQYEYTIDFFAAEIIATDITEGDGSKYARGWTKKGADSNMDLVYDPFTTRSMLNGSSKAR